MHSTLWKLDGARARLILGVLSQYVFAPLQQYGCGLLRYSLLDLVQVLIFFAIFLCWVPKSADLKQVKQAVLRQVRASFAADQVFEHSVAAALQ
jgi:hypothetical protein